MSHRATRWLALEADRRAWIARRERGAPVDPEKLLKLCSRAIKLSLPKQKELSVMLLLQRLPWPAEPGFNQSDYEIVVAFLDRLDQLALDELEGVQGPNDPRLGPSEGPFSVDLSG